MMILDKDSGVRFEHFGTELTRVDESYNSSGRLALIWRKFHYSEYKISDIKRGGTEFPINFITSN